MDAVRIDSLPTTKSLLSTKIPETSDIEKEKGNDDMLYVDEIDEDDEIRLRLSDDEEIEQDNTSGRTDSQQSLQLKNNDLEFDVHIAVTPKEASNLHSKEFIINEDSYETNATSLVEEDSLGDTVNEKLVNGICSINDEESIMSGSEKVPPLMHNSPKYWSNNFDKRWKGTNNHRNRQNYRNSNEWYNGRYSDKDKFNNRNNYNNHNNHFNKLRSNSRNSYNSPTRENSHENSFKEDTPKINESPKLKTSKSDLETKNVKESTKTVQENQENGISKKSPVEINCTATTNSSSVSESKKFVKVEEKKDLNEKDGIDEPKAPNDIPVESSNKLEDSICESEMKDVQCNNNGASSVIKNCDLTEHNKDISEAEIDKPNHEAKDTTDSGEEKIDNAEPSSENVKLNSSTVGNDSASSEMKNKTAENTLKDDETKDDDPKTSIGDQVTIVQSKDEGKKEIMNDDPNADETTDSGIDDVSKVENRKKESIVNLEKEDDSANGINNEQNEDVDMKEASNELNEEKKSEQESSDSKKKVDESMDVDNEASTTSETVQAKENDTDNSKDSAFITDEKFPSDSSPLISDDINNDDEEKVTNDELEESVNSISKDKSNDKQEKINNIIEEVDLADDDSQNRTISTDTETIKAEAGSALNTSQTVPISPAENEKVDESNEEGRAVVHKRRRRKRLTAIQHELAELPIQDFGVRQKRRSARNAEEMIRKECLKNDQEDDSNDSSDKIIPVNYRKSSSTLQAQPLSPPSLKRTLDEIDSATENVTLKRIKAGLEGTPVTTPKIQEKREFVQKTKEGIAKTNELVRKISQEDIRGKLKKLNQEELEALLLQKIIECITIRGEMGKLREQARVSKRNQEATRAKCQQLQKQVEGFDMVLKRITYDKNANNDKYVPPIKINRSVGLQVNFLLQEHGVHNLKQIQALKASGSNTTSQKSGGLSGSPMAIHDNHAPNASPRKVMKTRSPRRPDIIGIPASTVVQTSQITTTNATTIVMNKQIEPKRTITIQNPNNIMQILPNGQQQTVVVNSNLPASTSRATTLTIQRTPVNTKTSDLIDLTDEEDKTKTSVITPITTAINTRFPRVLQVPASVALSNTTNLRLVQAGTQGSQTAIVNTVNNPRLAYVMQSGVNGVPARQLVITNSNTMRPVTSVTTRNISTTSYKQGVSLTNGTVRVLTTQASTTSIVSGHPAPLPETPVPESNPSWKSPPPAPSLKISKVSSGIVLSWNMTLSDKIAEIVSYQLYAYQEVAGTPPSAALWKKVGDVRALPLPMACTLTQFTEGNNYYFAVRAVDVHSRFGQYSKPGNISL